MSVIAFPVQPFPIRRPPGPTGESGETHVRLSVFALARAIEPDPAALHRWYETAPITELDGSTARELVEGGQGTRVMAFLSEIMHGRRG
jgi:hypothetical protein